MTKLKHLKGRCHVGSATHFPSRAKNTRDCNCFNCLQNLANDLYGNKSARKMAISILLALGKKSLLSKEVRNKLPSLI